MWAFFDDGVSPRIVTTEGRFWLFTGRRNGAANAVGGPYSGLPCGGLPRSEPHGGEVEQGLVGAAIATACAIALSDFVLAVIASRQLELNTSILGTLISTKRRPGDSYPGDPSHISELRIS